MIVDCDTFRTTMSYWASGVSLVTSSDGEVLVGLTVSAFVPLSLSPPLVLVCIDRQSSSLKIILRARQFAVNILAEGQEELSQRFATRRMLDKFAGTRWRHAVTGAPVLDDALAWLDCRLVDTCDGGDHLVLIGLVLVTHTAIPGSLPLLYYRRGYQQLRWCPELINVEAIPVMSSDTGGHTGEPNEAYETSSKKDQNAASPTVCYTAAAGDQ
jgi:flavin reductase (DIM6/NTAB) family NADH-FMN oxidoreductase RutF